MTQKEKTIYANQQKKTDLDCTVCKKQKGCARQAEELAEGYQATAIRKNGVGEFYYDRAHGTIDWRNEYGEEVSLIPADWTKLAEEIPKMLKILGADGWTIENEG